MFDVTESDASRTWLQNLKSFDAGATAVSLQILLCSSSAS
jgi:hypothetical protein